MVVFAVDISRRMIELRRTSLQCGRRTLLSQQCNSISGMALLSPGRDALGVQVLRRGIWRDSVPYAFARHRDVQLNFGWLPIVPGRLRKLGIVALTNPSRRNADSSRRQIRAARGADGSTPRPTDLEHISLRSVAVLRHERSLCMSFLYLKGDIHARTMLARNRRR
jgi:hypothetical protein